MTSNVIALVPKKDEPPPPVNHDLIEMFRELLAQAEAGDILAAAVAYEQDGIPNVCFEADGYEAVLATAARQIDGELRAVLFEDE